MKKEHKNVIQTIKNLTAENSAVKDMFIENTYFTERGRKYKCYEITRDGFSLLVMKLSSVIDNFKRLEGFRPLLVQI